jgi:hypothetical protein
MWVTHVTRGVTALVESRRPPSPTSSTTSSTPASRKSNSATAVVASKNVGARSAPLARSASTWGRTRSTADARSASSTSRPPTRKRSVQRSRWGEVKVPTRRPAAESTASASRAVDPLPLDPAMWRIRRLRSGRPSRSSNAWIGAREKRAYDQSGRFSTLIRPSSHAAACASVRIGGPSPSGDIQASPETTRGGQRPPRRIPATSRRHWTM